MCLDEGTWRKPRKADPKVGFGYVRANTTNNYREIDGRKYVAAKPRAGRWYIDSCKNHLVMPLTGKNGRFITDGHNNILTRRKDGGGHTGDGNRKEQKDAWWVGIHAFLKLAPKGFEPKNIYITAVRGCPLTAKWDAAEPDHSESYPLGFHVFLKEQDADAWGTSGLKTVKVEWREARCFGLQDGYECVVAKYRRLAPAK
jgi:hypothetical protein